MKTLEKYAGHIKGELYTLGVDSEVYYSDTPRMTIKTEGPIEKETIARHLKAAMYKLGVNIEVAPQSKGVRRNNPYRKESGENSPSEEVNNECLTTLRAAAEIIGEKCKLVGKGGIE